MVASIRDLFLSHIKKNPEIGHEWNNDTVFTGDPGSYYLSLHNPLHMLCILKAIQVGRWPLVPQPSHERQYCRKSSRIKGSACR